MEIIKDIAAVVGLIATTLGLITAICKPIRQAIINAFANKSEYQALLADVREIKKVQNESIAKQDEAIKRLDRVEKNVLENEIDRLKSELFTCGNRCRRAIPLHPEEFAHIREVYNKYNIKLKQNHEGTLEFEYILDYYNSQNFDSTK